MVGGQGKVMRSKQGGVADGIRVWAVLQQLEGSGVLCVMADASWVHYYVAEMRIERLH